MSGQKQWKSAPAMQVDPSKRYSATLHTNKGDITFDLLMSDAPKAVNNFVFLAKEGFYDNVIFHRIIKGFMIQGGDPTGTGSGGPGYKFADEPVSRRYGRGIVAMANAGPNTNGSQFFICHGRNSESLPPSYTIFGNVTEGLDVVDAIADVPTTGRERSTPTEKITISSVTITEK
ncbi:MAG TPA: peptidylprolyl isomerase [Thermomicrobiales bacterium]|jgi:peptidylprolyl isomerase